MSCSRESIKKTFSRHVLFSFSAVILGNLKVEQGPAVLSVGTGGHCLAICFAHVSFLLYFLLPLLETFRHKLKYCLPRTTKRPTIHFKRKLNGLSP